FALAGLVAALTSYSYAKLSVRFPSEGGTVEFLNQAFGRGEVTGSLNVLLWISYLVMLSLYSFACGSYGASFFPVAAQPFWRHIILSAVILLFTILNVLGATFVGRAEKYIVAIKICILLLFIAVGFWFVDYQRLALSTWASPLPLMAGGMIIFVAYEGFELIANTAQDVKNPKKVLPRAYYSSVGFVIALYIVVAIVTVGNLPLGKIVAARDYALAAAAQPFLGHFGFVLIAIAALLATSSAINATLYGSARISYIIAKEGELPANLERKVWKRPIEGLIITCGLSLLVANLFDLSSIATMGSAGFLLIFAAVNAANVRLRAKTESTKWVSALGAVLCLVALAALIWQTARISPKSILVLAVMFASAVLIETIYRKVTGRQIKPIIEENQ
ncbi:MAG: APC family permease, partial [bacterium]